MSFYGSMKVAFIKASTEEKLLLQFRELEIKHDGMLKLVNVYRGSAGVVGWYYHDFNRAGIPAPHKAEEKTTKKKTKKKVVKKAAS